MRKLLLVVIFLLLTVALHAQTLARLEYTQAIPAISPLYARPALSLKLNIPPRAQRKKTAGMVLVGVGVALQVAGVIVYKNGSDEIDREGTLDDQGGPFWGESVLPSHGERKQFRGAMMFVAGTGLAVPGTILWIKGAKACNQSKQTQSLRLNLSTAPSLSYRF